MGVETRKTANRIGYKALGILARSRSKGVSFGIEVTHEVTYSCCDDIL